MCCVDVVVVDAVCFWVLSLPFVVCSTRCCCVS